MKIKCETGIEEAWQESKKMEKFNRGLHFQTFVQMNFISHRTPDNISISRHSGSEMGKKKNKKKETWLNQKKNSFLEKKTGSGIAMSVWARRNPCSEVRLCRDETAAAGCVFQWVDAVIEGRGRRGGGEGWLCVLICQEKVRQRRRRQHFESLSGSRSLQRQTAAVRVLDSAWHHVWGTFGELLMLPKGKSRKLSPSSNSWAKNRQRGLLSLLGSQETQMSKL